MHVATEIAGREDLEAALERAELDFQLANSEYNAASAAVRHWKRLHPQLDSTKVINGIAYHVINANRFISSALNELCGREAKARQRFSQALRVRADLLRQLKRI